MLKRASIISTKVRALAALKIFRARARVSEAGGAGRERRGRVLKELVVHDTRFKDEITFERLLDAMGKHTNSLQVRSRAKLSMKNHRDWY